MLQIANPNLLIFLQSWEIALCLYLKNEMPPQIISIWHQLYVSSSRVHGAMLALVSEIFSTRGYDRLWVHLSGSARGDPAALECAHEGEEQACKAWHVIYGDLNPVIHKYNYNPRLESDMDLAILITLQLCLFTSFICWQGKYKKNAVSRKTINKRKYFYFTQRIFFVSVCAVHPPTFRWEI